VASSLNPQKTLSVFPLLPELPKLPNIAEIDLLLRSISFFIQTVCAAGFQFGFFGNYHFWQLPDPSLRPG
jgi:hypothetical protein